MRHLSHWSTEVFSDMADMKRRLDYVDDITSERAIGMLVGDMNRRGVALVMPCDPVRDHQCIELAG